MTEPPGWATLVRADNPGPMTLSGTNSWVLALGGPGVVVVDPGPLIEGHLQRLLSYGQVTSTIFTHHHSDHAESVDRFAELTGERISAVDPALCRNGGRPLDGSWRIITGGGSNRTGQTEHWRGLGLGVLPTPGHTADSVCLVVSGPDGDRAVLTGDTILGRGTTVVAHPDGDLGAYLDSLRALRDLGDIPVLPGHGPVLPSVRAVAEEYLAHRERRLEQVRAALSAGDTTAEQVVDRVYADIDPAVRFAALMSVQAQLAHLRG